MKPHSKTLSLLALTLTFADMLTIGGFVLHLTAHRPVVADKLLGDVYPMAAHGPPVYLNLQDIAILTVLIAGLVLLGGLANKFNKEARR